MKKGLIPAAALLLIVYAILGIRAQAGRSDSRPLFPSYEPETLISIDRSATGDRLEYRGGLLYQNLEGESYPLREETGDFFISLPSLYRKNLAGHIRTGEDWLPGEGTVLTYHYGKNRTLTLNLRYSLSSGVGEGIFLVEEEGKGPVYFLADSRASLAGEGDLRDRRLFPGLISGGDIRYYRLSTGRDGDESSLYNYELEKTGDNWNYRGLGEENPLKDGEINLLLLRLSGAEGDFMERESGSDRGSERFRVEIRDSRGNRFVLSVGDRTERGGQSYYRAIREGDSTLYLVSRETLSGLAPPLNRLLDL